MKRIAAAALAALSAAAVVAQDNGDAQLLALVAQARSRGCAGHAGVTAPLRGSDALSRAAQRIARGEAPLAALQKEGYRTSRVFNASFAGYSRAADVASAMAQQYCAAVTEPRFTDFGVERRGASWRVVMAGRLQVPEAADARAVVAKVLALTNQARGQAHRCGNESFGPAPPVRANPLLEQAAVRHAQDMAAHQYLEHVARDGSTPAQRITRTGYAWRSIGENVAAGQTTPEDVVQAWVNSPEHCANLMRPDFTEMGVGFAVNMDAKEVIYWAQEFGRTR